MLIHKKDNVQRIYILGISGTFMSSLALLAHSSGNSVSGCDINIYPPMSQQLAKAGFHIDIGYEFEWLKKFNPDIVIVGNVMKRGMAIVEELLNSNIPYCSGPEWLYYNVLKYHYVLAISGTHGKTTTSSMLAWILEYAGLKPGFLIGGIPNNFEYSSKIGAKYFVIEADEYDTAFFDKRSKFIHYRPNILLINNIEFDHADIFRNISEIRKQFHYLLRTLPSNGIIIANKGDNNITEVLRMGCWTPVNYIGSGSAWEYKLLRKDGMEFNIYYQDVWQGCIKWKIIGHHNVINAIAAIATAKQIGISTKLSIAALSEFTGVKRRLEKIGESEKGIVVYNDFAHHHTEIKATIFGLRQSIQYSEKILVILAIQSNTMKLGILKKQLVLSLLEADYIILYKNKDINWNLQIIQRELVNNKKICCICQSVIEIFNVIKQYSVPGMHILVMGNGNLHNLPEQLLEKIS